MVVPLSEPRAIVSIQMIPEGLDVEWRAILQDVVVMMGRGHCTKGQGYSRDEECRPLYQYKQPNSHGARIAEDHDVEDVEGLGR